MMVHLKHLEAGGGSVRKKHNHPSHIYELQQKHAAGFRVPSIYKQIKGHTTTSYCSERESVHITYIMSNEKAENSSWFQAVPQH